MTSKPARWVVVGVDGSPESLRAVDWAADEARLRRRPLRIVHAFIWPWLQVPLGPAPMAPPEAGLRHDAERILRVAVEQAERTAPGLEVSADLPIRGPAAALIEASHAAELLVVASRGLGGFAGLLLGSVGSQVAAHAACPVVVVRHAEPRTGPEPGAGSESAAVPEPAAGAASATAAGPVAPGAGEVLVGVDDSASSHLAVGFAVEYAARHGLAVVAVHAVRPGHPHATTPSRQADDLVGAEARLLGEALAEPTRRYPDVPVRSAVRAGGPAEVLLAEAARARLVVVGARGRGGFTGLLLGSVSQAVLHHSPVPVAALRADASGSSPPPHTVARVAPGTTE